MYGHGAAPPPRSAATVISLRVLFVAAGFLTCGVLACVPLFRVAVLRGRALDWVLAWVSLPLSIACFAVVGALPEGDYRTDIALAMVLLLGAGAAIHFLVVDIGHHGERRKFAGYASPHAPTVVHTPYGYPQPAPPYAPTSTPVPQPPAPHTPAPHDATPHAQGPIQPPPSPQRPAPARIDQVRAELDELSDYLRRHEGEGPRDGNHEGGR
ncbi:hypothetical protein G3I77_14065 [Streptomyces sp. D2-8]|uniref:hypothetical protein n=1 Tax=unclassified Streptomyces TaxID=2593676 RepID=UPI0020BE7E34|nr:hypothetical protein [Streptomyces sp. D2-8]MCK8434112.1 hypothetical protein [Streptomyces sp. D2-8]